MEDGSSPPEVARCDFDEIAITHMCVPEQVGPISPSDTRGLVNSEQRHWFPKVKKLWDNQNGFRKGRSIQFTEKNTQRESKHLSVFMQTSST